MSRARHVTLYGSLGAGSAVVEVALKLAGWSYDYVVAASFDGAEAHARLGQHGFVGQVPVLVDETGATLTESAAILLWIVEEAPDAGLAPAVGDPTRAPFLRWLMFLAAGLYGTFAITDRPERWLSDASEQKRLDAGVIKRCKALWLAMEDAVTPAPFLLGPDMSILDPYMAMMSRWRPRREWFDRACPKLAGAARAAEEHPVVAEVWARNFDEKP